MDNKLQINLADLSEPPIIEEMLKFIFIMPSRHRAPRNFFDVLTEYGISTGRAEMSSRGLVLSFSCPHAGTFDAVRKKFVSGMPWSDEISQYWDRIETSFKVSRIRSDGGDPAAHVADIINPMALSVGAQLDPQAVEAFYTARKAERDRLTAIEEELRQRYQTTRVALAAKSRDDYLEAQAHGETRPYSEWLDEQPALPPFEEWRQLLESSDEPRLLPAAAIVDDETKRLRAEERQRAESERAAEQARIEQERAERARSEQERLAQEEREREAFERRRIDFVEESEPAATPEQVYDDVAYSLSECQADQTFGDLVAGTLHPEDLVRQAVDRLISEGKVKEDDEGLHWLDQQDQ